MIFDDLLAKLTTIKGVRIITYFQIHSILTNKPNFEDSQMSANLITIKDYEENGHSGHQKTNPIQTQLKPIKSL
jgi:hypothetical protein